MTRMTRIALASNLLLYAELEPASAKGRRAGELILKAARDGVVPIQVLGEFLRVVQRRLPAAFAEAIKQAERYRKIFLTPSTTDSVLVTAAEVSLKHGLQLWDAVVCAAADAAGATILLTEDLQDGRQLSNLLLLNPFAAKNDAVIAAALGG
jgi:predicted nucleic acid-binding protein